MPGAMGGPIYSMTADEYIRWRIRLECQRVGCTTPTTVYWCWWSESIQHGDQEYAVLKGPHEYAWQGIVGWLDTVHAPLLALLERSTATPDASLT